MRRSTAALLWSSAAFLATASPAALAQGSATEKVTIYRDSFGVPHVEGETSDAVMFGAGYAIAHDRLAAMELARHNTQGRRTELVGASALDTDKVMRGRKLSDTELMTRYRALAPEHQKMIRGMVDGINKRVDEVNADPENLTPLEFIRWGIKPTRWTLTEYLALITAAPLGRDTYEIRNLEFLKAMTDRYGADKAWQIFNDVVPISDPDSPTTIPAGDDRAPARPVPTPVQSSAQLPKSRDVASAAEQTAPPLPVKGASRCLVIGPEKSASGNVLMLEATADGPEIHLQGGGFDNAGFGSTGWGVPTMGRGAQHGWLLVSGSSEAGTTFAEKLNPKNRYEYWYKGAWKKMVHRTETFRIKDGAPVTHDVAWTIHGPVIAWDIDNGTAYSQQMGVHGRELDTWIAFAEMGRAKSLTEFKEKGVDRLGWNLGACYGGEDGTIAYFEAGALPKKAAGVDPRLPTPGTGEYDWTGFLTPAEKPQMINPRQQYFMSWNSKATGWSQEGDNARIGATFRTWLGDRLAKNGQSLTLLDMREFNGKIFNALGAVDRNQAAPDFFAPYIRKAIETSDDPEVKRAGEYMLSFDGLYRDSDSDQRYDNPGLTLYRTWLQVAPRMIFGDDMGDWWHKIDADRYLTYQSSLLLRAFQGDAAGAPLAIDYFAGRDRTAAMIDTIKATLAEVKARFPGKDMAEWKQPIFWKYFDASLETPDRPQMAEDYPEHRLSAVLRLGPTMAPHNGGESWVGLMEIARDRRALYSVVDAGGQNLFVDPKSNGNPNLADQTMMHETNELKKIDLAPEQFRKNSASSMTIEYRPTGR